MDRLLDELRRFDALRDKDGLWERTLPAVAPTYADSGALNDVSSEITQSFQVQGIDRLYQHQAEAISNAMSGRNVVLTAPTASGKTIAFAVPMYEQFLRDQNAHALMIYPTKALALDQRTQITDLFQGVTDGGGRNIESWWYDGDVEQEYRRLLRENPPHVLITNPDMLHNSFLAHADLWESFLKRLKYVVVDEIHEYRGYFGSNVSMILRRFFFHLAQRGIRPQCFMASATCANAKEHAENLTGLPFEEVNATGGLRPNRRFYFIKPDIPHHQYWDILQLRTVNAALACMAMDKSVLVFCPTRNFAESCHRIATREVNKRNEAGDHSLTPEAIDVFRAGLSMERRHETQKAMREGKTKAVFTTNALELGIDIGSLDGIIMAGFPDSIMSAWQRIGRAGRAWDREAFVLYYARNNPLDQFYASNLNAFLAKPLDDLVVNPSNEELVERHMPCLLFETPDLDGGEAILGTYFHQAALGKLQSGAKPVFAGRFRPHFQVDIRGGGKGMFILKSGAEEIGTMSAHQRFREAYQSAIYMHGGHTYRVEGVETTASGGTIHLSSAPDYLRTKPVLVTTLDVRDIYNGHRWQAGIVAYHGNVSVTEYLMSVQEVDERNDQVLNTWVPDSNNAEFSNAHAFWLQLESELGTAQEGLAALQHILRVGALFTIPLDPHDLFPVAVMRERTVYIVENFPGGIGIARKSLERWRSILETGANVAESCQCSNGCPNCIVPPRSTEEIDKNLGITLAREMLSATNQRHDEEIEDGLWVPVS